MMPVKGSVGRLPRGHTQSSLNGVLLRLLPRKLLEIVQNWTSGFPSWSDTSPSPDVKRRNSARGVNMIGTTILTQRSWTTGEN
jgi:hypothetical protein